MALFFYSPAFILKGGRWIKCVRRGTHWGGRRVFKGENGGGGGLAGVYAAPGEAGGGAVAETGSRGGGGLGAGFYPGGGRAPAAGSRPQEPPRPIRPFNSLRR